MASSRPKIILVFTTVAKKSDAVKISKFLIKKKLAACVTTLPQGESRYLWKGKVCLDKEYVLMIKTTAATFNKLKLGLGKVHPYDCPEIIGIPIEKASKPYQEWLQGNVGLKVFLRHAALPAQDRSDKRLRVLGS